MKYLQIGVYRDIKHLTVGRLALKPPSAARRKAFPRGEGGFFIAHIQGDEKDG